MYNWLNDNKEIIAYVFSLFTSIMLIVSYYESRKSRRLQYLPFLRITMKGKELRISDEFIDFTAKPKKELLIKELIDSIKENGDKLEFHNNGVGFVKNLSIIIDYNDYIDALSLIELNHESMFNLKPLEDSYSIISFLLPIQLDFRLFKRRISKIQDKINSKAYIRRIKKNKKIKKRNYFKFKELVYNTYNIDFIEPRDSFILNLKPLISWFSLFHLFQSNIRHIKITLPLYISYYDLEDTKRKKLYFIDIIVECSRNGIPLAREEFESIINGNSNIEEYKERCEHSFSYYTNIRKANKLKSLIISKKYRRLR